LKQVGEIFKIFALQSGTDFAKKFLGGQTFLFAFR